MSAPFKTTAARQRSHIDRLSLTGIELTIRVGVLGLLLYFSFVLVRPFLIVGIWSVVLTVALYPIYDWMVGWVGGRRRLAALAMTLLCVAVVLVPAIWLVLGVADSL